MARTTITILCENTAGGIFGVLGEHGFAALIERDGRSMLFDTGQGHTLAHNAQALQKDLTRVDTVVLSHGHYDHTGGLPQVLFPPRGVELIAHPEVFGEKYAELETAEGTQRTFIGLKYRRAYLETSCSSRFRLLRECTEIAPGVHFSGEVPRRTAFEEPDRRLKAMAGGSLQPDPFLDDASLLLETDSGPVVLLGCAHAGMINILEHFAEQTGHRRFHAVIGGTHLGFHGQSGPLEETLEALERFGPELIAVSHCTGQPVAALCAQRFTDRFAFANAGWQHTF
jgi:7,8-dihydropterin-6-yl-methyl-4-(beta-D-ribofuranosyl)aminobenzene 5'-phosphate synthase